MQRTAVPLHQDLEIVPCLGRLDHPERVFSSRHGHSRARNGLSSAVIRVQPFHGSAETTSVRPGPVGDFRPVGAVLVRVAHVVDDGILHGLLQVRGPGVELWDAIDHVDDEVES
jgi:hypothetical protein